MPQNTASKAAPKPEKPARRSQAERSATTRKKVVDAAIAYIAGQGYADTSNAKVAKAAAVSNGAMTHQFASKNDLMAEVVRAAYEKYLADFTAVLESQSPIKAMYAIPRVLWDLLSGPEGLASTEIFLASRANPELADRLRALYLEFDAISREMMAGAMEKVGLVRRGDTDDAHQLVVAAIRGLTIDALYLGNTDYPEGPMKVLVDMYVNHFVAGESASKKETLV